MHSKLHFGAIGYFVKDIKTMITFYREVVGLDIQWDGGRFGGVRLENGIFINFCERSKDSSTLSGDVQYIKGLNGTMELTFTVPDPTEVDEEYDRLIDAGATPVRKPISQPYGLREAYVADPEGNLIEIVASIDD